MNFNNKITNSLALVVLVAVLALCLMMGGKIERKVAVEIDQVELFNRDSLTVGKGSDIGYSNVPNDFLTITREGNHFRWRVNDRYRDSLQYFKINDDNPNTHVIRNDQSQCIVMRLPTSRGDTLAMTVTGADVWQAWDDRFDKQKDVMVRHFAANHKLAQDNVSHDDSLLYLNQMQCHAVRSFFERKDDRIVLVILDRFTEIHEGRKVVRYARSGVTDDKGEKAGRCKVQFYGVSNHCYLVDTGDDGTFKVDGVNHVMKATVRLTDWGAGHVMVTAGTGQDKSLLLSYPKPITFVGTVDSLRAKAQLSSGIITLKQSNNSFPNKSDLYLPAFCGGINYDLCNLEFYRQGDSAVVLRDNAYNTTAVRSHRSRWLPFSLVPALDAVQLHSPGAVLHARTGFIDQGFFMSYLWLPLLVCLMLLAALWLPFSPFKLGRRTLNDLLNADQARTHRVYLSLLLGIGLCYCACKSLIALKLSYTYPYFEKLTGIMPIATSLMLLLMFSLAVVLSASLTTRRSSSKGLMARWAAFGICLLLYVALAFGQFGVIDQEVSRGMIASYFPSEVSMWHCRPWDWTGAAGINDTHRSVVYSLLAIEAVVLVVWLCCLLGLDRFFGLLKQGWQWLKEQLRKLGVMRKLGVKLKQGWHVCKTAVASLFSHVLSPSVLSRARKFANGLCWALTIVLLLNLVTSLLFSWALPARLTYCLMIAWGLLTLSIPMVYDAFVGALKTLFPSHLLLLVLLAAIGLWLSNFATAFITLGVILGLSRALMVTAHELTTDHCRPRHVVLLQMFFVIVAYTAFAMVGDHGYMTNIIGFFFCGIAVFFVVARYKSYDIGKERRWVACTTLVLVVLAVLLPYICSHIFHPENVDYSRMVRRVMLYSNFENLQQSGYRYSESDAEFMVIMSHYMQGDSIAVDKHDPLSNDAHFMHPSVSAGQSPVAINDLSVPMAFFGSYGHVMTQVVYFGLLLLLLWLVLRHSLGDSTVLTRSMCWRLLAMFMWVGTSLYIYFSYIDWLPFTGRLNPGLGVDAVGEALESALLLAFMGNLSAEKMISD